jgi:hypothetical protein
VAILSSGQTVFSLTHIEGITLGAGEEEDEVVGGASGIQVSFHPSPSLTHTHSGGTFPNLSCGAVFTVCSHTLTLF